MYCKRCGKEFREDELLCAACGAPKEMLNGDNETIQDIPSKRGKPSKRVIIPVVIVLAIAIIVSTFLILKSVFADSVFSLQESSILYGKTYGTPRKNKSMIAADGECVFSETDWGEQYLSMDGSTCVITNGSEAEIISVDSDSVVVQMPSDSEIKYCTIATSGNTVAFNTEDGIIYLYDIHKDTLQKINDTPALPRPCSLSPDGLSVAYSAKNDYVLYIYHDGANEYIEDYSIAVCIDNDCKYIYYVDCKREDNVLRCTDLSGKDVEVGKIGAALFTNEAHTQLMFADYDDNYYATIYVSENGEECVRIYNDYGIELILPEYACTDDNNTGVEIVTLPVKDLYEHTYCLGDERKSIIAKLNNNWKWDDLVTSIKDAEYVISCDGKTIYYTDNNQLMQLDAASGKKKNVYNGSYIESFECTSDGKAVYILELKGELLYWDGDEPITIAQDVSEMAVSHDDYVFYIIDETMWSSSENTSNKALYAGKGGKAGQWIANGVSGLSDKVDAVYYYTDGRYESGTFSYSLYVSTSGTSFSKIAEEVSIENP